MLRLLRIAIWILGALAIVTFVLRSLGYEPNPEYPLETKTACEKRFTDCRSILIRKGTDGARADCSWDCFGSVPVVREIPPR